MKEQDVITLDNGKEYILLDDLLYKDKKYFFALEVTPEGEIDENKPGLFFEEIFEDGERYVEEIEDGELLTTLLSLESISMAMEFNPEYKKIIEEMLKNIRKGGE